MREEFQTIEWAEPPLGDLVDDAVAQGRRRRSAKRLQVGGAGLAVLVVAGLAVIPLVRDTAGPSSAPAAVVMAAPSTGASSPAPATPETDRVKGTPAGLLHLLTDNLPKGKTSHYAGMVEDGDVSVQTFLTRGKRTGMIRLHVMTRTMAQLTGKHSALKGPWIPLGNGVEYQSISNPSNCIQHTIVYVRHADDTLLQFDLSSCLAWDGRGNKTSPQILTVREAAQVGADPRWGVQVDPAVNEQGAAAFPHLSAKFGK